MSKSHIKIENLVKKFGDFTALNNINLEIKEGEFFCFLGPSGCGKTTLLRAVAGLDVQTSGRVIMKGKDVSHTSPDKRDFGIVFQSYALFPNMKVVDNVAYGMKGKKFKKKEIKQRVKSLLDMVGLSEHAQKYPSQLSGGQQQRVALTRALATSPSLLLLDEPLSALDAKVRNYLRKEIKELQRDLGVTTIMVTHDQEEALAMADRIVILRDGVIEQIGTPEEIYSQPANAFVADFIGEMNFLDGVVMANNNVKVGEHLLSANTQNLAESSEVVLAIRPEDVQLGENISDNQVSMRVQGSEYLGSLLRTSLQCEKESAQKLEIRADVPMSLVRRFCLEPDKQLSINLPYEQVRVYPKASA